MSEPLTDGGAIAPVQYLVAPAVEDDALNGLFDASWPGHIPSEFEAVHRHSLAFVCAFEHGDPIGYVNVGWDGGVHAFLLDTTVHPGWRRRGIGRELVRRAVEVARARGMQWLHVDYEPHLAGFYCACGFRHTEAGVIRLDAAEPLAKRQERATPPSPARQLDMIERLRRLCQEDQRVVAGTLYGSFATGEADGFSDVEAALYFQSEALETLDRHAWAARIAPVALFFADDFGHYTAVFEDLVRGEFHFNPAERLSEVAGWRGSAWFPSAEAAILVDRTGELTRQLQALDHAPPDRSTPEMTARLAANFANGVLLGSQVLARGEAARSLEVLVFTLRYLEWLARLVEGNVAHWPTPSRRWERDLSAEAQARLMDCTARLNCAELARAYRNTWAWGRTLAETLAQWHGLPLPGVLYDRISQRVNALQEELEWQ